MSLARNIKSILRIYVDRCVPPANDRNKGKNGKFWVQRYAGVSRIMEGLYKAI